MYVLYVYIFAQLKNCQWLADFYHLVGNNWKEQLSSQGCDVSRIDVIPKPVDPVTIAQELEQFAKYALQITPGQEEWQNIASFIFRQVLVLIQVWN